MKVQHLLWLAVVSLLTLSACGGPGAQAATPTPAGDSAAGKSKFESTCAACHGPEARGVPGLGKDLTASEFVRNSSNAELVALVVAGRPASDPANTTGVDMPPRGGNADYTDQDLADIVAYLRTLQN